MKHLKHSHTRAEMTPPEWLRVGAAVGRLVNKWSGREDVVAFVGPGAGNGAPACYNPMLGEVEVDVAQAFGRLTTPEEVGDLEERSQQYEFPKATGAIMHEAFHARYSLYDLAEAAKVLSPAEHNALMLLEESRIEAQGVADSPESLVFLRASAMELAIGDAEERLVVDGGTTADTLATLVALVHGRVDAGILEEDEVLAILDLVDAKLGATLVEKLRDIARRAQRHDAHRWPEPLYVLAREWAALVREAAEERGEGSPGDPGGEQADGQGGGGVGEAGLGEELLRALREAAEDVEVANHERLTDQQTDEEWRQAVKDRKKDADEALEKREIAGRVFGSSTREAQIAGTHSVLQETRPPTSEERVAAVKIATLLEKAKYRDRDATEIASVVPPGRLRTRAVVQAAALRDRGVMAQTEPWRRTVRRQTDDPTLTVGVMVDISGSMNAAMEPMATTAWVMSEAVRRVQGRCAMVYYGNDVFATLAPGEHLRDVRVYTATDHTEKFDTAFRALDGSLNLLNGDGARLLVVVSDGHYTGPETAHARRWVAECGRAGVAVLWLPFNSGEAASRVAGEVAVVAGVLDPVDAADQIGRAAAASLSRVGTAA